MGAERQAKGYSNVTVPVVASAGFGSGVAGDGWFGFTGAQAMPDGEI